MELKTIRLADYQPYPKNPNLHPDHQVQELQRSLDRFGQVKNVVVWRGYLLAGHGLCDAARRRGDTELQAVDVSHWTQEEAEAFLVADNRLAEMAITDEAALLGILQAASDPTSIPGFDDDYCAQLIARLATPDLDFPEYDEDIAEEVEYLVCPNCGHRWLPRHPERGLATAPRPAQP